MFFKRKNNGCRWRDTIVSPHSRMHQEKVYLRKTNIIIVWDKTLPNRNIIIHISADISMSSSDLRKTNIIIVWDKTLPNRNIIIHISADISMSSSAYQETKYQKDGITIVLEFPQQSEQADNLLQEIRSILAISLREQLQKNLITSTDRTLSVE